MLQRPFYLIAHHCNWAHEVEDALKNGANAIECDIRYNEKQGVFVVNHDHSLSYERDSLVKYLQIVKNYANTYSQFGLMIFDCKEPQKNQAHKLIETIRNNLTNEIKDLNIIISVAEYKDRQFFDSILSSLGSKEGLAIDYHNTPKEVSSYFQKKGVGNHCYGNGITSILDGVDKGLGLLGLSIAPNVRPSIVEAIALKKKEKQIKLVYVWTLKDKNKMKDYLRMGVDGIFVEDVNDLKDVLKEPEFSKSVRLATRKENAFAHQISD